MATFPLYVKIMGKSSLFHRWYGYGSIPIDTFWVGWTSIYQLFWGSLGTRVLTHCHIFVVMQHSYGKLSHFQWVNNIRAMLEYCIMGKWWDTTNNTHVIYIYTYIYIYIHIYIYIYSYIEVCLNIGYTLPSTGQSSLSQLTWSCCICGSCIDHFRHTRIGWILWGNAMYVYLIATAKHVCCNQGN